MSESSLTAPSTLPTRLPGTAVSSTSWDCRPAQSTPSTSLCPTSLEQCGSTLQSDLYLVSWCRQFSDLALGNIHSFLPLPSGRPSTPQVTLTPTAGGLTVQLTVMYPGTREDTLQYSISTSASSTRQLPLPVTDLTTPVSGSVKVAFDPGTTYSVTVYVTNQYGSTTSSPQQVTTPGWYITAHHWCILVVLVFMHSCLNSHVYAENTSMC